MFGKLLLTFSFCIQLITYSEAGFVGDRVEFYFYTPGSSDSYFASNIEEILENSKFNSSRTTVFYFYGFTQTRSSENVKPLRNAYIDNGNYNFITVSLNPLLYTVFNAKEISDTAAEAIQKLITAGVPVEKFEIVGFSLGAQIGARTARKIPSFPKVIGLDPGQVPNIPFFGNPVDKVISSSDANFVMTVHTEKRAFGDANSVGHANFWVNGAQRQPMCITFFSIENPICSHEQAQLFWAEAVRTSSFPARKCNSYTEFKANGCNSTSPAVNMGPNVPVTLSGNYYLNTNKNSPYSKPTADP